MSIMKAKHKAGYLKALAQAAYLYMRKVSRGCCRTKRLRISLSNELAGKTEKRLNGERKTHGGCYQRLDKISSWVLRSITLGFDFVVVLDFFKSAFLAWEGGTIPW